MIDVLLVETNADRADAFATALAARGFCVRRVSTGEKGLTAVRERRPHVVITELLLPRMSGLVLAALLKAAPATTEVTIVAMTTLLGEDVARLAQQAGCAACVSSTIAPEQLASLIAERLKGTV